MGKIMHTTIKGMGFKAKIALISLFTLLLTLGLYQGWQMTSHAAIGTSQAWSSVYAGTAFPAAGGYSYTVNAGTDRLLVVALQSTVTAAATQSATVTWGGRTLTQATGDGTTSAQAHTYLFYLKEADIAAASGTTLIATVTGGTTSYNFVRAAVYTGVDQAAPIKMTSKFNSGATAGTAVGPLSPTLTIATGEQAVEIINLSRTGSTTSRTITVATPWTSLLTTATGSGTGTIGVRNYILGDTTAGTGVTSSYTASGTTLSSIAAMVISPKTTTTLTVSGNTPIAPTGTRLDTDTGVVMQRVQVTGSGAMVLNSVTLDDIGTANTIASAEIYISPTSATVLPVDAVLVGSATNWGGTSTQFSLTGGTTANRSLGGTEPLTKYLYVVYDMSSGQATKNVRSSITAVGVVSPNIGATGLAFNSNVISLDYSGNLMSTAANTAGASAAKDSDVAVVMQHFAVDCNTAFDNAIEVNSITLEELGTNTSVGAVRIYISATEGASPSTLPTNAVLIGQLVDWNKASVTIPLTNDFGAAPADRTILAGTPKYLYVVYSMFYRDNPEYFANPTVTAQSRVTAVGATSPDTGVTGLSYLSNLITLSRGTWSKITNCGSCHDTQNIFDAPTRSVDPVNNTGRFPGSHRVHTFTDGYDCAVCHSKPTVFNHASGFINFSGVLRGDKYTRSVDNKVAVSNSIYPFGTCNNTNCHGQGSPVWAYDMGSTPQCQKCHADQNSATFYSTASPYAQVTSPSDLHVGAHDGHVKTGKGYADAVTCADCHTAVSAVNSAGHMNGTVNFNTSKVTSYNPANGTCTSTCHKGTSVVWNDTAYLTGTPSATECAKCHAAPPATSTHTGLTVVGSDFSACVPCHQNLNTNGTFKNKSLHMNGIVNVDPSSGGFACNACHSTLTAMTSDTTSYHHVLASTNPDYAGNTCLKCHVDHNIFQSAQNANNTAGVAANLRVDTAVTPAVGDAPGTSYTNTDFVASATNGGICTSCHINAIAKNTTAQKNSADINATTMVVTKAQYTPSAHNYIATSTYTKDSSTFQANCTKCHNDTLAETKQSGNTFGLHLSATRELFSPLGSATGLDAREQLLCYGCHSQKGQAIDAQTPKPTAGKDWYGIQNMSASAEDTYNTFNTKTYGHFPGNYIAKHQVGESQAYISANKHVECADCHNSHSAKPGNHTLGSATLANALAGATGAEPTAWPAASYGTTTSATLYLRNTAAINAVPPTKPAAYQYSSGTYTTNTFTQRDMAPTSGTTSTTTTISAGTTAARYNRGLQFVSPQINQAVTINSGSTFTLAITESANGTGTVDNTRFTVYKWNGTTATPFNTSAAPANFVQNATAMTTAATTRSLVFTSNQSVTLNPGEALVCDVEFYHTSGTVTDTISYTYGNGTTLNLALPAGNTYIWRTTAAATWATPAAYTSQTATQEYQICFKCHTPANTSYASWGGTGAASWTDLAMEFNPNNASRHPIGTPLTVSRQLTTAKLTGGWAPGMVMNCTDCHATDSTASKGPHGSSVKWMLSGTNKAWPYTAATANGTSTGTLFRIATYNTGAGTVNGLFCLNCHQVTATNPFHSSGDITGGQHGSNTSVATCVACHIRVPHGGKVTRLRATVNAPARYSPSGNGGTFIYSTWAAPGAAVSGNFKCSTTTRHSGGTETW